MFKITITEVPNPIAPQQPELGEEIGLALTQPVERYSQTVDTLDIPAVMAAVNKRKRVRRKGAKNEE